MRIGSLVTLIIVGACSLAFGAEPIAWQHPARGLESGRLATLAKVAAPSFTSNSPEELPAAGHASDRAPLREFDLAALQALAAQNNPSLREAWAQMEAARGRWVQAGRYPNPIVGYSGQQLGSNQTEQNGVLIGQEIITAQKLRFDQGAAAQEIERAHQQYHAQYNRVLTDTAVAYYEALAAQQRVALGRRLVGISDDLAGTVDQLVKANEVSRIELLQAKIEASNSRVELTNAENRLTAAWRSLATVVGLPTLPQQTLADAFGNVPRDLSWEASLERLQTQSPEVGMAVADAERARWQYQRAMRQPVPNVTVQSVVQYDKDTEGMNGNLQVTLPIPLFNRNQGGIREASANIVVAEQAIDRVQLQLEQRLAGVFERYASALQQVERYGTEIVPASQEQLDLVTQAFRAGEVNYLSLLIAQRTYFQAQLASLAAHRDLAVAASEIEGLLLTDSLGSR
jgi:outer membrane protein, heavy metal efflux system